MKQNKHEVKSILHYFKGLSLRETKQHFFGRGGPNFKGFKPKFYRVIDKRNTVKYQLWVILWSVYLDCSKKIKRDLPKALLSPANKISILLDIKSSLWQRSTLCPTFTNIRDSKKSRKAYWQPCQTSKMELSGTMHYIVP